MAKEYVFHEKMYLGESMGAKKLGRIKRRLKNKPLLAKVYLILPAENPNDQLEIVDARQLAQSYYRNRSFLVLGMASDRNEALGLMEQIVRECFHERRDCNLREFFEC